MLGLVARVKVFIDTWFDSLGHSEGSISLSCTLNVWCRQNLPEEHPRDLEPMSVHRIFRLV